MTYSYGGISEKTLKIYDHDLLFIVSDVNLLEAVVDISEKTGDLRCLVEVKDKL